MKLGCGVVSWQRASSERQTPIVCWSRVASSRTPQRRSIAWKRASCSAQRSRRRGKTLACSALRSAAMSSNVELTKIRKVRVARGIRILSLSPDGRPFAAALLAGAANGPRRVPLSYGGYTFLSGGGPAGRPGRLRRARPAPAAFADAGRSRLAVCLCRLDRSEGGAFGAAPLQPVQVYDRDDPHPVAEGQPGADGMDGDAFESVGRRDAGDLPARLCVPELHAVEVPSRDEHPSVG